jgi:hypothetical protein
MNQTTTIYHRDGRERTVGVHEASRLVGAGTIGADKEWSLHKPPPIGWQFETPKYKATRDVEPAPKARFRSEPPFTTPSGIDIWQYGERPIKAGEIIETREWPHPSFRPLNYCAGKVLDFFNMRQKSRLARSPWAGDRIRLDDGLTGPGIVQPVTPKVQAMDLRPAS